ncbi:malate synthase [Streptomyces griseoviridis]
MSLTALPHPVHDTPPDTRVVVLASPGERHDEIVTPAALDFVGRLAAEFGERRRDLLKERRRQAMRLAGGSPLDFPMVTSAVRADPGWRVAPPAPGLVDRRVEITAPPRRPEAVEALRSGAQVWIADFSDATSPTWENVIGGQLTLRDVVEGRVDAAPAGGGRPATVVVRPRGWHLDEEHLAYEGRPVPAALVDFGLYFFHCAQPLIDAGYGPYFSLPKLENRYEARLWNDVFDTAQGLLGIPRGTVRACVPIETVTAAFEMEEILHELRTHSSGLGIGHEEYLTSLIRTFGHRSDFLLPDRARIPATASFLHARAELVVRVCHRRGAHAVGAVSARVPEADRAARAATVAAVRLEKEREAENGFDGSRVTHPALVPVCRAAFDEVLGARPHQLDRSRDDIEVTAAHLLSVRRIAGPPTPQGVRAEVAVALRYFAAWQAGHGTVTVAGRTADAATAELARTRIRQWLRHRVLDRETVLALVDEEAAKLAADSPTAPVTEARALLERTALTSESPLCFTPDAYSRHLVSVPVASG